MKVRERLIQRHKVYWSFKWGLCIIVPIATKFPLDKSKPGFAWNLYSKVLKSI